MPNDKELKEILLGSREIIELLCGLTEILGETGKELKKENKNLIKENKELLSIINQLKAENNELRKREEQNADDKQFVGGGKDLELLQKNLRSYYHDLSFYDEGHITAEDGERLYHTIKYIFKQLKKIGVDFNEK